MAQKGIREYHAKLMLSKWLAADNSYKGQVVLVDENTHWDELIADNDWLLSEKLVAKPDQLFGKRGKHGLLCVNKNLDDVKKWIQSKINTQVTVGNVTGELTHFLIEPYTDHSSEEEWYIAIRDSRDHDTIYFSKKGGVDVEENWDSVSQITVPILTDPTQLDVATQLGDLGCHKDAFISFVQSLYAFYTESGMSYLEINPFTFSKQGHVMPLDMVVKLDDTASFDCRHIWNDIYFPRPFGNAHTKEEDYIQFLDAQSGASLKLTILNPKGSVWTMVAGGGASVIYADTVCDLGF